MKNFGAQCPKEFSSLQIIHFKKKKNEIIIKIKSSMTDHSMCKEKIKCALRRHTHHQLYGFSLHNSVWIIQVKQVLLHGCRNCRAQIREEAGRIKFLRPLLEEHSFPSALLRMKPSASNDFPELEVIPLKTRAKFMSLVFLEHYCHSACSSSGGPKKNICSLVAHFQKLAHSFRKKKNAPIFSPQSHSLL